MATAQSIDNDARERFKNAARSAQSTISARVKSYTDLLRGCASLLQTNESITRVQFHRYVEGLSLSRHFPAIETINYARYITDAERDRFEAQMRAEAGSQAAQPYTIDPPGRRDAYSVLTFIEPSTPWLDKFGLDIQAKPQVAKAMMASRDSGMLSTSGQPISAMSAQNRIGLGMRLPIYRIGLPIDNVERRRAAYLGSVGVAFSVHKLVQGVLDEMPIREVRLTLIDGGTDINRRDLGTVSASDLLLFDSAAPMGKTAAAPAPLSSASDSFGTTLPIDFNGRLWKAQFSVPKSNLNTGMSHLFPWLALLAGFVSSMLIYALFHTLSSSRLRAIKMAKSMTKELRDSQAKLQISHQKLRRLAAHADQIKEHERKRIAREIHDDLGQNLLALRIEADILASRTHARHPRLHARARATLSQIDATIKSVRQIINELRPNVLDLGLNAAVEWQIAEFRRRTGIVCELIENNNEIRLDDHCATAFFRILQESLSNISRHARASLVRVQLQAQGDRLTMMVSDNGIGMPEGGRNKIGSFGLVGIEERINLLGGSFAIVSSPGGGTAITVSVPLPESAPLLSLAPPQRAVATHS